MGENKHLGSTIFPLMVKMDYLMDKQGGLVKTNTCLFHMSREVSTYNNPMPVYSMNLGIEKNL
jgi:hypothetical protein